MLNDDIGVFLGYLQKAQATSAFCLRKNDKSQGEPPAARALWLELGERAEAIAVLVTSSGGTQPPSLTGKRHVDQKNCAGIW